MLSTAFNIDETGEILAYYAAGLEGTRLLRGIGQLEFARTKEILLSCLPPPPAVIYDVGGGTGAYSCWLARLGYEVHLFELCPENVVEARAASQSQPDHPVASLEVGDGRQIARGGETADAVLVMGPLYHLPERAERLKALAEARRVLKPGGTLAAAAISRFGSTLYGLTTCGQSNWLMDEPEFTAMIERELEDGQHIRPAKYPRFIARAFFHLPGELQAEVEEAGFTGAEVQAVEGPGWVVPNFDEIWADENRRETILGVVRKTAREPSLMGMSPHLIAVARK